MKKILCIMLCGMILLTACNGQDVNSKSSKKAAEESKGYVFTTKGTNIGVDMEAAPIIDALGEPNDYFGAPSCAFDGMDKIYTYGGYEIRTYPLDEKDYIASVLLKDDMTATVEGVSIYMKRDDMIAVYGDDYIMKKGMYVYENEGMELQFVVEEDEIVSIQYVSPNIP